MTASVLRRIVSAHVHSAAAVVPMSLEYRTSDPLAVGITLGTCVHRLTWHVARSVIAAEVAPDDQLGDTTDGWASSVFVMRPPGSAQVALGLRWKWHRWVVTVAAADLQRFLAATYEVCPVEREAQIVADELDVQCGFFYLNQGGGNPA